MNGDLRTAIDQATALAHVLDLPHPPLGLSLPSLPEPEVQP